MSLLPISVQPLRRLPRVLPSPLLSSPLIQITFSIIIISVLITICKLSVLSFIDVTTALYQGLFSLLYFIIITTVTRIVTRKFLSLLHVTYPNQKRTRTMTNYLNQTTLKLEQNSSRTELSQRKIALSLL